VKLIKFSENLLDKIIEISNKSFANPWTKEMFLTSVKNNFVIFKVLTENNMIIGYYIICIVTDETEILDIAVSPEFRKKKFGKYMLLDIKKETMNKKAKFIFLEVRKDNIPAINLYKSVGFKELIVRKKYYKNEDALVFKLSVNKENML
jgi:ribosomal-protein-alanine N-acetyltransferase